MAGRGNRRADFYDVGRRGRGNFGVPRSPWGRRGGQTFQQAGSMGRGRASPNSKYAHGEESGWQPVQRKRQRQNTGGQDVQLEHIFVDQQELDSFKSLSVDEKLNKIMGKLFALDELNARVTSVEVKVTRAVDDISEIKDDIKEFDLKMKTLEYKAIDQEARSRRNNLIFWGLQEIPTEDCEKSVLDFVYNQLEFDPERSIAIQRAHRLGQRDTRKDRRRSKPRPLVACFRDFKDVDAIISRASNLKGTDYGISRDFPKEINDARKILWPQYKQAKATNPKGVFLKYPAKLIVNKVVIDDLFPNWFHFIRKGYMADDRNNQTMQVDETSSHSSSTGDQHDQNDDDAKSEIDTNEHDECNFADASETELAENVGGGGDNSVNGSTGATDKA